MEDKGSQHFPQAASKLLALRGFRRSYTKCMNSVTHVILRIFESCVWDFKCFKTVISDGIS